jgi:fatty-acid desaturase
MDATEAKNLIELLAGRSAAWSSLWTMFYTIAAAVVGVVASGKLLGNRRTVASAIAALFATAKGITGGFNRPWSHQPSSWRW